MHRTLLGAPLAAALLLPLAVAGPAQAAPTCTGTVPTSACGGRVVAEPQSSTSFHQFDGPAESLGRTLQAIAARSPGFLEVKSIADWTGDPAAKSFGGRPMYVVRVTDESVPRQGKKQVAASLSVHGLEAAGREGGLRYLEDLAIWTADPAQRDRPLYAGDVAKPLHEVMEQTEAWIAFTNPDGWAQGDLTSTDTSPGFQRNNDNNKDLNRDYGTVGWYDRTGGRGVAESEPETRAWTTLVRSFPDLATSTDIHGELTTPNDAFSDLIIPAGQWTPTRQQQVKQLGDDIIGTVARKFSDEGVVLDNVFGPLPADGATPRRPANVAASYDIVGYDDSGFMGDWFSQTRDSVHMDVENFLSNLAPNNGYNGAVEQTHVAAVRGILEATVVESMVTRSVRRELAARSFAYVDDPNRTTSADGTQAPVVEGETQVPYDVSRMRYFQEIAKTTGRPAVPLTAESIAAGTADLDAYPSLVLADMELPAGSTADRGAYVAALKGYAARGGQLVLTDRGLSLLDDLGIVPTAALTVNRTDAGHVDFLAPLGDDPYEKGLVGKPSQTYYEVMLGFPSRTSAPNYGVERTAWEKAGGKTVATVGGQGASTSPNTALGSVALGAGKVVVLGALLPQAIEKLVREDGTTTDTPHPFGLADYAVTITGGQVLDNVLAYDRAAPAAPSATPTWTPSPTTPAPSATPGPSTTPTASSAPSPSTAPTTSASASPSPAAPACGTPSPVVLPRSTILSGASAEVRMTGTPGSTLTLQAYTRPSTAFRAVRTVSVGPDGTARVSVTPPSNTRMYAQEPGCAPGPSAVLTVRSTLSLDTRRTGTRTVRFFGNSLPKRAQGLPISLYRVEGGREVLVGRTRSDARTATWSLTRSFPSAGRSRFLVRTPADSSNAAGASAPRSVAIR